MNGERVDINPAISFSMSSLEKVLLIAGIAIVIVAGSVMSSSRRWVKGGDLVAALAAAYSTDSISWLESSRERALRAL